MLGRHILTTAALAVLAACSSNVAEYQPPTAASQVKNERRFSTSFDAT